LTLPVRSPSSEFTVTVQGNDEIANRSCFGRDCDVARAERRERFQDPGLRQCGALVGNFRRECKRSARRRSARENSGNRQSDRGRREIVRDVDLVVATKKPAAITEFFIKHSLTESIIAQGPTKTSVRLRSGIQCDLRVVTSAEYPFALNYFTGSKEHNIEMRS